MILIHVMVIIFLICWILYYADKYKDLQHSYELLRNIADAKEVTIKNLEKEIEFYKSKEPIVIVNNKIQEGE